MKISKKFNCAVYCNPDKSQDFLLADTNGFLSLKSGREQSNNSEFWKMSSNSSWRQQEEGVGAEDEQGGASGHTGDQEEDSGCECSIEDLDGMDAWTKTLVAIKVLTAFKKRRKKKLEQEKIKKERRKTLWKRLGFKLRVFNMFANKISSDDPTAERLVKLKRKLGAYSRQELRFY